MQDFPLEMTLFSTKINDFLAHLVSWDKVNDTCKIVTYNVRMRNNNSSNRNNLFYGQSLLVIFTTVEHMFKAYEHIFKGGEQMFTVRKHKIYKPKKRNL